MNDSKIAGKYLGFGVIIIYEGCENKAHSKIQVDEVSVDCLKF